jgi:hypothetical protein
MVPTPGVAADALVMLAAARLCVASGRETRVYDIEWRRRPARATTDCTTSSSSSARGPRLTLEMVATPGEP